MRKTQKCRERERLSYKQKAVHGQEGINKRKKMQKHAQLEQRFCSLTSNFFSKSLSKVSHHKINFLKKKKVETTHAREIEHNSTRRERLTVATAASPWTGLPDDSDVAPIGRAVTRTRQAPPTPPLEQVRVRDRSRRMLLPQTHQRRSRP